MSSTDLLHTVAGQLWDLVDDAADDLAAKATSLSPDPGAPEQLRGRLLVAFDELPDSNPLAALLRDLLGDLRAGDIRLHGWQRQPDARKGVALVAAKGDGRAVLAATPGPPALLDLVVTPGADIAVGAASEPWQTNVRVISGAAWETTLSRGAALSPPVGTVRIEAQRAKPLEIVSPLGAGASAQSIRAALEIGAAPASLTLDLRGFQAALLPEPLAAFLGAGPNGKTTPSSLQLKADAAGGLRFEGGGLRVQLPVRMALPALSAHGFEVELGSGETALELTAALGLKADLPGVPVHAQLDGVGVTVPVSLAGPTLGPLAGKVDAPLPRGIAIELALPPVSGGGAVHKTDSDGYAGVLDLDLGVFGVQAIGLVDLPKNGMPTSVLALLSASFPYPGIQLGFGFALDAVGGIVGINRRVDTEQLRALVSDGNADRILFPENAVERSAEIARSLEAVFPPSRGRCVVGPMVRISWGGRIVTLSGAVVLDLPGPAQILILGRLLVAVPDPVVPLIRLQASVLGRIDPAVPETEVLVSLSGSWIAMIPVSGELFLLVRGGRDAVFVLSAGGFHPRYTRPPGVPPLRRLSLDLGGGFLGLRAEAYLAVTSNALMFGAKVQLDATIAGCGVEGQLDLDALFVWEPTFSFSVHVHASVAVLALGIRLASVGLDFTLGGPVPWRAFGTGSVGILWEDFCLDFDVSWGELPPPPKQPPEVLGELEKALAKPSSWTVMPPPARRSAVKLSERAKSALAEGKVVEADATLRVSQMVVPLKEQITRFGRARVPTQEWDIRGGEEVRERFVAGEFFDLTDDQQLTMPAFVEKKSGVSLQGSGIRNGTAHAVDDGYETVYKVGTDFDAPPPGRGASLAIASFGLERFVRVPGANERLALWHSTQEAMPVNQVAMR